MDTKTNQALVCSTLEGQHQTLVKKSIPTPTPSDRQVLVKVLYVAQNPTDVQSLDSAAFGDGAVLGCDFVGVVEDIGNGVTRLAKGDVIAALIWGGEIKGLGAYSQYCVADERICFKVPAGISYAEASTIPLALTTSWLALFSSTCLNIDRAKGPGSSILVKRHLFLGESSF